MRTTNSVDLHSVKHSDHGTVLKPTEAALVVDEDGEMRMLMPDYAEDQHVPLMVLLLSAVLVRSCDPEWIEEMLVMFKEVD